ncbi:hypothetical protein ALC57_12097, partial [Trachymyrmex cornetzi]
GDFNARTGREGRRIREENEDEEEEERSSMDSKKNKEGNKLVEVIREKGWSILNGNVKGDEKGNWTYTEEIDSDHHPLVVSLRGERGRKRGKEGEGRGASRGVWDEGGREVFRERVGRLEWRKGDGNERMKEMGERIREILRSNIEKERKEGREGDGEMESVMNQKKTFIRLTNHLDKVDTYRQNYIALLIDKDRKPLWKPTPSPDVINEYLNKRFAVFPVEKELQLCTRKL